MKAKTSAWAGTSIWLPLCTVLATLLISLTYVESEVPREIWMLSGPTGTATYDSALRYKEYCRQHGVQVHIESTAGGIETLYRLSTEQRPQIGFAEAGIERFSNAEIDTERLVSLGSLQIEPSWLFGRDDLSIEQINDLEGHRVVVGVKGSGARTIAEVLMRENGIENKVDLVSLSDVLSQRDLAKSFDDQAIDAAFLVGHPNSTMIDSLLQSQATSLVSISRATAYTRLNPFLARLVIPEGLLSIPRDIPNKPLETLGLATNLVSTKELHPAIVDLMLDASKVIYAQPSSFTPNRRFPSREYASLPLSRAALRYYDEGPPRIRRYLPFWLATFLDRFKVVILAVASVATAAFGLLPKAINLRFRMKLMSMYRQLEQVEKSVGSTPARELQEALRKLDAESREMSVPATQRAPYFEFRQNLHDVGERIPTAD